MKLKIALTFTLLLNSALASDWPQLMGPNRNGTSSETGILREWPESGPEVLWTTPVGNGFGGPAISDGRVYILDRKDEVGDFLRCLDLSSGEELWRFSYDAPGSAMFPGSRGTPTVDGNFVYSCGHNGDLYCVDINTQKPVWSVNVWTDFGGKPVSVGGEGGGFSRGGADTFPIWAITQCPLIYGDLLIIASQAPEAGVVAYNKSSGKLVWKTPSLGYVGYVSPSIVKIDGEDHVVMVSPSTNPFTRSSPDENNLGVVTGVDPKSGKILWQYDKWNCHISVASALDVGNNKILVVGGYELGATMLQVKKSEDGVFSVSELFTTEEFGGQTKPPVMHDGHFYAEYGTNRRRDGLVCMNMEGKIMWKTRRSPEFNKGSMIVVDGLILATNGAESLYLVEPNPKEFRALASADLLSDAGTNAEGIAGRVGGSIQNWAPIALSNGRLIIRDHNVMKCVRVGQ